MKLIKLENGNLKLEREPGDEDVRGEAPCDALHMLLEPYLTNGWTMVPPETIGALTSGEILSDEVEYNEDGDIGRVGRVYWNRNYMVQDAVAEVLDRGECIWIGEGESLPPAEE